MEETSLLKAAKQKDKEGFLAALPHHTHELKVSPHILHMVCYNGWLEVAKVLIEDHNMDPSIAKIMKYTDILLIHKITCLHSACMSGNIELVEYLMLDCYCNVYEYTVDDLTVLHFAILGGIQMVKYMVTHLGAGFLFSFNAPRLMKFAYDHWDNDLIKYLIVDHKCSIIIDDHTGDTILHWACRDGHVEQLAFLLNECECNINVMNGNDDTLLHTLCKLYDATKSSCASVNILTLLLENTANCLIYNADGIFCLEYAIMSMWPPAVIGIYQKAFINTHVDANFKSCILSLAYQHWNESIMHFLIVDMKYAPDIPTGGTILHEACKEMRLDKLKFLNERYRFADLRPLLYAFASSSVHPSTELLLYLKQNSTYPKALPNDCTPLQFAIINDSSLPNTSPNTLPIVQCFVEVYGPHELYTLLELMHEHWSYDFMKYLLVETNYCGLNSDSWRKHIASFCQTLCANGEYIKFQFLINECQVHIHDNKMNRCYFPHSINRQCSSANKPLRVAYLFKLLESAVRHGKLKILTFLFKICCLNLQDESRSNISGMLNVAYFCWDESIIKYLLLRFKSDNVTPIVDEQSGNTILHKACKAKDIYRLKFLYVYCDPNIINHRNKTLIRLACKDFDLLQCLCIDCNCCPDLSNDQEVGTIALKSAIKQKEEGLMVVKHLVEKCHVKILNVDVQKLNETASFIYDNWCPDVVKYLIVMEAKFEPKRKLANAILYLSAMHQNYSQLIHLVDCCHCSPCTIFYNALQTPTLIHVACSHGNSVDFKLLHFLCIDCGCCPDLSNDQEVGTIAMKSAIKQKEKGLVVVKHLVEKCGVKILNDDVNKTTAFTIYDNWCPDVVKYLIVIEAELERKLANFILYLSALHQNHIKLVYLVNCCHCSPDTIFHDAPETPTLIHAACSRGAWIDFNLLHYLCVDCGCCPDLSDDPKVGTIAMKSAIKQAKKEKEKGLVVVKHLVEKCQVTVVSSTIVLAVYQYWCRNIAKYLFAETKFINLLTVCSENRSTIIHLITKDGNFKQLKFLLETCQPPITNELAMFIVQCILMYTHDNDVSYILRYLFIEQKCIITADYQITAKILLYCCTEGNLLPSAHYLVKTCMEKSKVLLEFVEKYPNHNFYSPGFLSIINEIITNDQCNITFQDDIGNTVLHLACNKFSGDLLLIELFMSTGKADPLCRNSLLLTPLMLFNKCCDEIYSSSDDEILKAQTKARFEQLISRFGEVQITHQLHLYVNVFLLGNPGVGKSTLVKVIKDRKNNALFKSTYVKDVELRTAGIIPSVIDNDKDLGKIILHDLAGQPEYYTSHTAVLENLLQGSAAVFVLVVSLADENNINSFHQWLNILENVCDSVLHQCQLLVVASHVDQQQVYNLHELKHVLLSSSNSSLREGKDISICNELFTLDCRKLKGTHLENFISVLSQACESISSCKREMSLYCHMLYDFFQSNAGKHVYTFHEIIVSAAHNDTLYLPKEMLQMDTIISELSATGLIVFLRNPDELAKSWIVVNKEMLLSDLNGVLFAPPDFKQHVNIASNIGVVKISDLGSIFPDYDPNLLVQFLDHMELCSIIRDQFIHEELDSSQFSATNIGSEFIFVPALINKHTESEANNFNLKFGWCLHCSGLKINTDEVKKGNYFFLSRFLHLIQLRLACKFANLKSFSDTFERYCKLWTKGIHWKDTKGVETLVEVADSNQALVVLVSCEDGAKQDMLNLIWDVIAEILSCKQQVMPQVVTDECIISSPRHRSSLTSLPFFDVPHLAQCYINHNSYILANDSELNVCIKISDIIAKEMCTKDEICTAIFAGRDPQDIIKMRDAPVKFKRGQAPVAAVGSSSSEVDISTIDGNLCSEILRSYTPTIIDPIDPLKFANDLCSVNILTDLDVDEIQSTTSLSRYEKASRLMNKVKRYLNALEKDDKARFFMRFCQELEKQGNDRLTEISKEMIAKCQSSHNDKST